MQRSKSHATRRDVEEGLFGYIESIQRLFAQSPCPGPRFLSAQKSVEENDNLINGSVADFVAAHTADDTNGWRQAGRS